MEIPEIVNQIVDYIPTVDFSKTDDQVSLFETTVSYTGITEKLFHALTKQIRYLGGMISGYDLLTGPLAGLVPDVRRTADRYQATSPHDQTPTDL